LLHSKMTMTIMKPFSKRRPGSKNLKGSANRPFFAKIRMPQSMLMKMPQSEVFSLQKSFKSVMA
jgi:hypothetical protein